MWTLWSSWPSENPHFLVVFCFFIEMISNEKEREKGIGEPMPHFDNKAFSESDEKVQCNHGTPT
jgi:hypothetical protein